MKPEDHAWRLLQERGAARLRPGFADRVLRTAQGPTPASWRQLQSAGAAWLRPGFAERVLRAARQLPGVPSLRDQFAFSAVTAAVCLIAVVAAHTLSVHFESERNLAGWQQLADDAQDIEQYL